MPESRKRRCTFASIAIALSVFVAACSSSDNTTAVGIPTAATTAAATESFSGSVGQLGTTGIPFVVANSGTVTISLTSVAPLSTMSLGVGVASWDGTTCGTALSKNDNARSGTTALTGTANAGNYCVTVYDSGNIPDGWTVQFSVQVVHP